MKTIAEMKETARNFFIENGFVKEDYFHEDTYYIPGKCVINSEHVVCYNGEEYEVKRKDGLAITVQETYRNNGTAENQSIYIEVITWSGCSGRRLLREKLYSKHGAKKTAAVLQKVLEAYNG